VRSILVTSLRSRSRGVAMPRHPSRAAWPLCAALLVAAPVGAEPAGHSPTLTSAGVPGRRVVVDAPATRFATPAATISSTLYLERCPGGCVIRQGANDARTNTSVIPKFSPARIGEFANGQGAIGADADAEWKQILRCMREVYSPYNVVVTDVRPPSDQGYHEAIIAGSPSDIGLGSDILGVAPLAGDCSPIDNVISFSFAGNHSSTERVLNICWTAAQESAHAFGLDHEYAFSGGRSACNDPMTYSTECGGQKFFRNERASCGETKPRPCKCGTSQNSHKKLLSVFGAGTPITSKPTIVLDTPMAGGGMLGGEVVADAGAQRGVARVEVWFNGFPWADTRGARFNFNGQPDPATYTIIVPTALPDSIVDVKTVAYDDLEIATESAVVTVVNGAPCTTAVGCARGQKCEAGRCFWDPPTLEFGARCEYSQLCKSLFCETIQDQPICTQKCVLDDDDVCPSGFVCAASEANSGQGVCFFSSSAGCCSVDRSGDAWLVPGGIAAVLLGVVTRRRRARHPR